MPCHIVKTEPLFAHLEPVKHGFAIHELLGHAEEENPATFGVWTMDAGNPVTHLNYSIHCFVAITEGDFWVEDLDEDGKRTDMTAGDIFHVPLGSSLRWGTLAGCKGIYVQLKALGDRVFVDNLA